jgi:hypothetical protein
MDGFRYVVSKEEIDGGSMIYRKRGPVKDFPILPIGMINMWADD